MIFNRDGNAVFECTGAETWASCNVISIDNDLGLATGQDCSFHMDLPDTNGLTRELLPAERAELADHYIALWTRFKEQPS